MSLVAGEARADAGGARNALDAWDNFLDAIQFSDSCTGRSDIDAMRPLAPRIAAAKALVASRYPELAPLRNGSDTDYTCNPEPCTPISHRALRKTALELIDRLEAEARP